MGYYDEVEYEDVEKIEEAPMKVAIIGSTHFIEKMKEHKELLELWGYEVRLPVLDERPELDALGVTLENKENIKWADRVDILWDQRSTGTILDLGMTIMADKPIRIIYLESKTMKGLMEKWERVMRDK
jgi:hypothetical protein